MPQSIIGMSVEELKRKGAKVEAFNPIGMTVDDVRKAGATVGAADPDAVRPSGPTERQKAKAAAKTAQYPLKGVDTTLGTFLPEALGTMGSAMSDPFLHPVDTAKSMMTTASKPMAAVMPFKKDIETGNYPAIAGKLTGMAGAAVATAGITKGVGKLAPPVRNAALNAVTSPEGLVQRAGILRQKAATTGPMKGGIVDDAVAITAGRALGGPTGAAMMEIANVLRQMPMARNARAALYEKWARDLVANDMAPPGTPLQIPDLEHTGAASIEGNMFESPTLPRSNGPPLSESVKTNVPAPAVGTGGAPSWTPPDSQPMVVPRPGMSPSSGDLMAETAVARSFAERQASMEQAWQMRGSSIPERGFGTTPETTAATSTPYRPAPDADVLPPAMRADLGSAQLNKWMNVSSKQVAHGANPGQRILAEKLIGPTKEATKTNVDSALGKVGSEMETQLRASAKLIDVNDFVVEELANTKKRIGAPKDAAFVSQIDGIWEDITARYPNLDSLSPLESHRLKVDIGDAIKWSGEAASNPVNKALVSIYRGLNAKIKSAVSGIAELQDKWSDLYVGSKSLKESLNRDLVGRGTGETPPSVAQTQFRQMKQPKP